MTYTINNTMIGDTIDTITLSSTGAPSQVYTTNNTSGSGLYWGINGTSASPYPGQVLTTNGTNTQWATITADPNLQGATLHVKGDAEFEGDLKIKGKSINDSLERIEERLAILRPNEELEAKWENLRALRQAYKDLEAEIIEKEQIWGILKK